MDGSKRVIYIAGPITGVKNYWEAFEQAEEDLLACGCIPLSPAKLPEGMIKEQYMRMCFAMIDSADAVLFMQNYASSGGASLEREYCYYIGKPCMEHRRFEHHSEYGRGPENPPGVRIEWLKYQLREVFGE